MTNGREETRPNLRCVPVPPFVTITTLIRAPTQQDPDPPILPHGMLRGRDRRGNCWSEDGTLGPWRGRTVGGNCTVAVLAQTDVARLVHAPDKPVLHSGFTCMTERA